MSLFTADQSFQRRARPGPGPRQARRRATGPCCGRRKPARDHAHAPPGESAGAAFAVVLDEIRRLQRRLSAFTVIRRLVEDTSIAGRIDEDEGSLCRSSVEGYRNKLKVLPEHAAQGGRSGSGCPVRPKAATGQGASDCSGQTLEGRGAGVSLAGAANSSYFRQALAVTAVLALAGGGFAVVQEHAQAVQRQIDLSVNFANRRTARSPSTSAMPICTRSRPGKARTLSLP